LSLIYSVSETCIYSPGKIIVYNNEPLGNFVPGSITTTVIYGLIAIFILRRKNSN